MYQHKPFIWEANEKRPWELHRQLTGMLGTNPYFNHNSASRNQMLGQHLTQTPVIAKPTVRRSQTGVEDEYGRFTFSIKMPVDGRIIAKIPKYRSLQGEDEINGECEIYLFYINIETGELDTLVLPLYHSNHQYFGFRYKTVYPLDQINVGDIIKGGTILLDSPSVDRNQQYMQGRECNVAYLSLPQVAEDGIMICKDVLPSFRMSYFVEIPVSVGEEFFALNMYGDENYYKAHPDIGEYVRDDGILIALRAIDPDNTIIGESIYDVRQHDDSRDKMYYVKPGSRIVDVEVFHGRSDLDEYKFDNEKSIMKYAKAYHRFCEEVLTIHRRLDREYSNKGQILQLSPRAEQLLTSLMLPIDKNFSQIKVNHRKSPVDTFRIVFKIEYHETPRLGNKFTNQHGGKGVITYIAEPEEMPVDANGNRADFVIDPHSVLGRTNVGQVVEQYMNGSCRDVAFEVGKRLGCKMHQRNSIPDVTKVYEQQRDLFESVWQYICLFYQDLMPSYLESLEKDLSDRKDADDIRILITAGILEELFFNYTPAGHDRETLAIVHDLETHFVHVYGPVEYVDTAGHRVKTKRPVRVASQYFFQLEKDANDHMAASSGKRNHFGVIAQPTRAERYQTPMTIKNVRFGGESEIRLMITYAPPVMAADFIDGNNNEDVHREKCRSIVEAINPSRLEYSVDRSKFKIGSSDPLKQVKHSLECAGIRFTYNPYVPDYTSTMV